MALLGGQGQMQQQIHASAMSAGGGGIENHPSGGDGAPIGDDSFGNSNQQQQIMAMLMMQQQRQQDGISGMNDFQQHQLGVNSAAQVWSHSLPKLLRPALKMFVLTSKYLGK